VCCRSFWSLLGLLVVVLVVVVWLDGCRDGMAVSLVEIDVWWRVAFVR